MNMNKKIKLSLIVVLIAGFIITSFSGTLFARTVWKTGTVTKEPWFERYQRIEVDDIQYTFMPNVERIVKHTFYYVDQGMEEEISFNDIKEGDDVLMRVQGFRIYEFIIEDGAYR
jgi:hypothetical protein